MRRDIPKEVHLMPTYPAPECYTCPLLKSQPQFIGDKAKCSKYPKGVPTTIYFKAGKCAKRPADAKVPAEQVLAKIYKADGTVAPAKAPAFPKTPAPAKKTALTPTKKPR
jgi:hypothetical protein